MMPDTRDMNAEVPWDIVDQLASSAAMRLGNMRSAINARNGKDAQRESCNVHALVGAVASLTSIATIKPDA